MPSYDHIKADRPIKAGGGGVAFQIGDPIPLETADRLGIDYTAEDIWRGSGSDAVDFADGVIVVGGEQDGADGAGQYQGGTDTAPASTMTEDLSTDG